jgi:adenine-specific DNA methylase
MTDSKSFIEVQFPVSKVSKESYKERKAGQSQTLTGLGKWWGRKPLILVRSALLGLLMPSGDNPQKDREIFLKILSMDEQGLWLRKNKPIKKPEIKENLTVTEIEKYFAQDDFVAGLSNAEKQYLQKLVFERMSYDDKLTYCLRPEELVNISENAW